jgi:hypothetical protein
MKKLKVNNAEVITGTLHIYLEDYDIDLRGIYYSVKNGKFFIRYASKKGNINGTLCDYLIFSFNSAEKQRELTKSILTALYEFAETSEYTRDVHRIVCYNK